MLGLPDGVTACLFDMDGVVTKTAVVHAAAWKQMFDEFLPHPARPGPVRPGQGLRRVRRRQAAARGHRVVPGVTAHRPPRRRPGRQAGHPHRVRPLQPEERAGPRGTQARRGRGLPRLETVHRRRPRGRPQDRHRLLERQHRGGAEGGRGGGPVRRPGRRQRRQGTRAARQARPRHLPRGRPDARRGPGRAPPSTRTRWPASRPAGRASSGWSWAWTGSARPTRCARTAPTWWSRTWRTFCNRTGRRPQVITNEPYGAEPWSLTESSLNLDMLAQSESVFALSNGHIGLRGNLDEGEPNGLPGTYLNSVYEDRPLPVRGGRLRVPRHRADRHQRDQRQDHPAAGRRRAVRHQVRHPPRRTPAPSTCGPAP